MRALRPTRVRRWALARPPCYVGGWVHTPPEAWYTLTADLQRAGHFPPSLFGVDITVISLPEPSRVEAVVGWPMVRAVTVACRPSPAPLTASPFHVDGLIVAEAGDVGRGPVTSGPRPPSTTYPVIGRPSSSAHATPTSTAPGWSGWVWAVRFCAWPGVVNGTTVLADRRGGAGGVAVLTHHRERDLRPSRRPRRSSWWCR